jgi:glycine/D-amino acid oxidase-like deaminating enzyme
VICVPFYLYNMQADYLIIGQGISGTFLAYYLQKAGASVMVVDQGKPNSASRVAAGLINPVTGRRLVKSWMIEELMPFAWNAYTEIGQQLDIHCIRETSLLQFFHAPDMQDAFHKKLLEEPDYVTSSDADEWREYFNYPFGAGTIAPCYLVNMQLLLNSFRQALANKGQLLEETLDVSKVEISDSGITYKNIRTHKIIFCDGEAGMNNPWFNRLPYAPNKGEALLVRIPGLPPKHVYKFGHMLIPVDPDKSVFWFGSSYEWNYTNDLPGEGFRKQAEIELQRLLKVPFEVLEHKAGIRAANVERRPFVGLHPLFPQLGILNGMGTKGCSLSPYFAQQMAAQLIHGTPVLAAVDVNRFSRILNTDRGS